MSTFRQRAARDLQKRQWAGKLCRTTGGTSWWVGTTREAFAARRQAEAFRMGYSKFGQQQVSGASCDDKDESRENAYRAGRKRLLGLGED